MQVGDKMYIPVVITELDKWDSKNTAHVTFADGMGACSVFTETLLTLEEVQQESVFIGDLEDISVLKC